MLLMALAKAMMWPIEFALLAGTAGLLPGCAAPSPNQRLAAERSEKRVGSLARTVQVWSASEQRRPRELSETLDHAGWYFVHQAQEFDRNLKEAGRLIERDLRRVPERVPPYSEKAREILWGKPERIEGNAILLFF